MDDLMTDINPHTVEEPEGQAYTIREFVTGTPLPEVSPDTHGVFPVSPLGFLNAADGTPLGETRPTTAVVTDGTVPGDGECYVMPGDYSNLRGTSVNFPVTGITVSGTVATATVEGNIPAGKIYFENATSDDYAPTGLVDNPEPFAITPAGTSAFTFDVSGIEFAGTVGPEKLRACVYTDRKYVKLVDNPDSGLDGYYLPSTEPDGDWTKVCSLPDSPGDGPAACHARNGYSDTEVADWVGGKMRGVYNHAVHPSSGKGDLSGAGPFVNWFVSGGDVNVAGPGRGTTVMVPGFGLGDNSTGRNLLPAYTPGESGEIPADAVRTPLVFGYGTKYDAWAEDVGKTALPLDWPFTDHSEFADNTLENNITLVRKGVNGGAIGPLDRESHDACETCGHTGVLPADAPADGKETGDLKKCMYCGGVSGHTGCPRCAGTGWVSRCPDCEGTGYSLAASRLVMDRVHLNLYNDFRPKGDGTTVLKKTFVNLAAPIDTEDGDEFEITVSLPNVNTADAFGAGTSDVQNLSAYYAYVSQPRVYVMGGRWDRSRTRVDVLGISGNRLELSGPFEGIDDGTRIRFTVRDRDGRRTAERLGTVTGSGIELEEALPPLFSAYAEAGRLYICGAYYVPANDGTLAGITDDRLGLNGVRTETVLGRDSGSGVSGELGQYNRFYSAAEAEGRNRVDPAAVVAAVYPTVTNTFPWAINHRRKLSHFDRLMTMCADIGGVDSMVAKVHEMNKAIMSRVHRVAHMQDISPEYYPLGTVWPAYSGQDGVSAVGALLRLGNPGEASYRPVRQAVVAVRQMADDFRRARISNGNVFAESAGVLRLEGTDRPSVDSSWTFGAVQVLDATGASGIAQRIRLRHLPEILAKAGTGNNGTPVSEYVRACPYSDGTAGGTKEGLGYYASNPYGYAGEYSTVSSLDGSGCDCMPEGYTARTYSVNSVVRACTRMDWFAPKSQFDDLLRAAEIESINLSPSGSADPEVYYPREHRTSAPAWMELFEAFTKLASPDGIPVPGVSDYSGVEGDQMPFISGDAFWTYRKGVEDVDFIAADMPTDDPLARFLEDYVPCHGAALEVRNWDSNRVLVKESGQDVSDPVYRSRMAWYSSGCADDLRGKYAADAFLLGDSYKDVNLNRVEFKAGKSTVSTDWGVPPFTSRDFRKSAPFTNASTPVSSYVRVHMKFAFSAESGRWYCTDYRQAPVSYLSPLYGAQALEQEIGGKRLWVEPACNRGDWRSALYRKHGCYVPMDINPALVAEVSRDQGGGLGRRLARPYLPVEDGGLGLSAPVDKYGGRDTSGYVAGREYANFWSVRKHLRPATGAIPYGDIPSYGYDAVSGEWVRGDSGGVMADQVLWGQFDYPAKGVVRYHLPDTTVPDADLTVRHLVYARENEFGVLAKGDIQVGTRTGTVLSASYGENRE